MTEETNGSEGLIHVMDATLANKIAAGEVVQRPASVLKEMMENAIDAGADQVDVILKASGRELVQVIDNGCGMGPQDALACFLRHATSKIQAIEDLEQILTLGFRGEALASIAAVAQVEMRTKRMPDAVGTCIRIEGGEVVANEPCATPNGTSLSVRNLFYNVPVRRNFLKTPATEFKHLVETFQFLALSHPHIGFSMVHDGNEVYRLTASTSKDPQEALRHRIAALLGRGHGEQLIPVAETTSYISVRGFVGAPKLHRKGRGEQYLFVNNRFIKNRYLEHAVAAAYEQLLPEGTYPFFTLFLQIDPRHVDVNVHPTKAEVKFDDERGVYGLVKAVVQKALSNDSLTPQLLAAPPSTDLPPSAKLPPQPTTAPTPRAVQVTTPASSGWGKASAPAAHTPKRVHVPAGTHAQRHAESAAPGTHPGEASRSLFETGTMAAETPGAPVASQQEAPSWIPDASQPLQLWQLRLQYILVPMGTALLIIDQQAAHERVLYEQALETLSQGQGHTQQLLFPQTLDLGLADRALLEEIKPELQALGFDIQFFSGRSVVVQGVPADVRAGAEQALLEELLAQYKANHVTRAADRHKALARSYAKKMAVRQGEALPPEAMQRLINQLFACEMPYACPAGRPTLLHITPEELAERFARGG